MDDRLMSIAAQQGGYFTRAQALDCGASDRQLRSAVREGHLSRIRQGTYAFREIYDALTPQDQHVVLARSVIASMPGPVALSHRSGSAVYGHDQWGWDMSVVDVTRLDGGAGRQEAGVFHHVGVVDESDLVESDGLLVLREDRVVVEACLVLGGEAGLCTVDSALRHGRINKHDLERRLADFERWQGAREARLTVLRGDGRAASVGESRMRHDFWRGAIPEPDLQYEVRNRDRQLLGITDFAWLEWRHVAEFDGMRKYRRDLKPGEDPGEVVAREKVREDLIRAECLGMSRVVWPQLSRRSWRSMVRDVRVGMEQSRRLYGRGRVVIA
jgi:hypothetical protein